MGEKTEVRAELKVDDAASKALEGIRGGFEKVGEKAKDAQREVLGMAKQAVATAVGFQFDRGIESLKELATESFHAALAAKAQQGAIAGSLAMADRQGRTFLDLKKDAVEYHEALEEIGIKSGVSSAKVIDAFSDIMARSSKSSEEVLKFTEQMAMAGKAWPGGVEALSSGFEMMQLGMIRGRNPIVQLISATHTLGGNAKEVAAQLQKMSPEQAMELGEKAIAKMAEKTKNMPLGFNAIVGSLKDIREQLFATMGGPMVATLSAELGKLRGYLMSNREAMKEWAKMAGEKAGEWIKAAGNAFREGFAYVQSHASEIKAALSEAAALIKEAFMFVVSHKDELLMIAKLWAAGQVGSAVVNSGAGQAVVGGVKGIAQLGAGATSGIAGAAGGGIAGGAVALGAAFAALAAVTWAVVAAKDFEKEHMGDKSGGAQAVSARAVAMKEMAGRGDTAGIEKMGKGNAAMIAAQANFWEDKDALEREMNAITQSLADASMGVVRQTQEIRAQVDEAEANFDIMSVVGAYNRAIAGHNDAAAKYAAEVLLAAAKNTDVMVAAGTELAGGIDKFVDLVGSAGRDAAGKLGLDPAKDAAKKEGAKPPAAAVHMSGGQTFNIKQEFRDADPDRVLVSMRRDIVKQSEARRQGRLGTPFGF